MSQFESENDLEQLAELFQRRNEIDGLISQLIGRPAHPGHIGEFIAATIFDIKLHESAVTKASDGVFRSGSLAGRTVNIKWYSRASTLLDLAATDDSAQHADYYLVLTGPRAGSSMRGEKLSWSIAAVYLFNAHDLVAEQVKRGVNLGIASSVPARLWQAAMIYPESINSDLRPDERARTMLTLFAP